ncbi:MAG: D-amino acid aminotransferase [Gammaproteobacteria bacterium]|nr:D-amino acid aminotransferase [Gammaproteobacteria bacterium]MCW8972665.1 D-amino acid aminotransferase [Gammaproteobacteria bacterium]MCW8992370.1 D-amino acid aminotransferase [Gammaproteobacteria bacterium]
MSDIDNGIVYLNGEFLPAGEAKISVLDRGFIFGDGVYEVIPVYGGHLFRLPHHLQRLDHSLEGIHMANPLAHNHWQAVLEQLVELNGGGDQSLYLQVTRGVAKRDHGFPPDTEPTVFAMSNPISAVPESLREGIAAATVEDFRWKLCHIKAIALLPNILLRQQAVEAGAEEAIMLRDGFVTEGAASNVFIVNNGVVLTPPKSNLLLPGVTRDLVVELCQQNGLPCVEGAISEMQLKEADEIWLTSSSREIIPVTRLDGLPVGDGRPGRGWQQLIALYQQYKQAFREGRVT